MLRIGDASKKFNISNRTLRYWEEEEILKSTRMENGYRFYDDENTVKIQQITLLRKLKIPISDIKYIFKSNDSNILMDVLINHLKKLKQEILNANLLTLFIENIIEHIKHEKRLEIVFSHIEAQIKRTFKHEKALQNLLLGRNNLMLENQLKDVRIIKLPAMTVASYRAESETPEKDCSNIVNKFVLENQLYKKSGFRHFGFNNPNPSESGPIYGYEIWIAIPEDFHVPLILL